MSNKREQQALRKQQQRNRRIAWTAAGIGLPALLAGAYMLTNRQSANAKETPTPVHAPIPAWMLIQPGFTPKQIADIVRAGEDYDKVLDCETGDGTVTINPLTLAGATVLPGGNISIDIENAKEGEINIFAQDPYLYDTALHAFNHACETTFNKLEEPWLYNDPLQGVVKILGYEGFDIVVEINGERMYVTFLSEGMSDYLALKIDPAFPTRNFAYGEVRRLVEQQFGKVPLETITEWRLKADIPAMVRYVYGFPPEYKITIADLLRFYDEYAAAWQRGVDIASTPIAPSSMKTSNSTVQ